MMASNGKVWIVSAISLGACWLVFHANGQQPKTKAAVTEAADALDSENLVVIHNDLISRLMDRVARLEARVASLETTRSIALEHAEALGKAAKPIPRDWGKKEINGIPYYIVPLESDAPAQLPQER